jgi:hypothetical protein
MLDHRVAVDQVETLVGQVDVAGVPLHVLHFGRQVVRARKKVHHRQSRPHVQQAPIEPGTAHVQHARFGREVKQLLHEAHPRFAEI